MKKCYTCGEENCKLWKKDSHLFCLGCLGITPAVSEQDDWVDLPYSPCCSIHTDDLNLLFAKFIRDRATEWDFVVYNSNTKGDFAEKLGADFKKWITENPPDVKPGFQNGEETC